MKWNREADTKGWIKIADKHSTAVAYLWRGKSKAGDVPVVKAYCGKRQKPDGWYRFPKGAKAAERYIKEYFEGVQAHEKAKADYAAQKKAEADEVQVGGIYYTSWGYDQTNVDFYQVVGRTAKMVKYIPIGKTTYSTGCAAADEVVADPEIKGKKVYTAKINGNGWRVSSFEFATPWDGKPKHQTAYGWGH